MRLDSLKFFNQLTVERFLQLMWSELIVKIFYQLLRMVTFLWHILLRNLSFRTDHCLCPVDRRLHHLRQNQAFRPLNVLKFELSTSIESPDSYFLYCLPCLILPIGAYLPNMFKFKLHSDHILEINAHLLLWKFIDQNNMIESYVWFIYTLSFSSKSKNSKI